MMRPSRYKFARQGSEKEQRTRSKPSLPKLFATRPSTQSLNETGGDVLVGVACVWRPSLSGETTKAGRSSPKFPAFNSFAAPPANKRCEPSCRQPSFSRKICAAIRTPPHSTLTSLHSNWAGAKGASANSSHSASPEIATKPAGRNNPQGSTRKTTCSLPFIDTVQSCPSAGKPLSSAHPSGTSGPSVTAEPTDVWTVIFPLVLLRRSIVSGDSGYTYVPSSSM